ncbi:aminotransferase-like domain-containing protein [Advenella kashmirensis]|uniref:hypothetical protein n=1 Tax=Advenella kashmirensis TaxID=310575 RepID=UPI001EE63A72|nr:hypothetical protein [Advenella kashmirensis]
MAFTFRFAEPFAQVKGSPIRELFRYLSQPGMISFAGGYPAPELFDEAGLQTSLLAVAHNLGTTLSYGATEGWPALRASFARLTTERAIPTQAEQLIVTSGSQQGFELLLRASSSLAIGWSWNDPRILRPFRDYGWLAQTLSRLAAAPRAPIWLSWTTC